MKGLPPSLRLLADENVSLKLVKWLSGKGYDIKFAEKGLRNSQLHSIALSEDRVLLTHDLDFSNIALYSPSSGTIILDIHPPELPKLESAILKLFNEFSSTEIKGKAIVITDRGFEILT